MRYVCCPRCGKKMRQIGKERLERNTGIAEYDVYCDTCDITVNIEDRSAFEQLGKIMITFA